MAMATTTGTNTLLAPVRQPLDIGPAVLRALNRGDDVGHSRRLANGRDQHDGMAVGINGSGVEMAAGLLFHRRRFASQHRFIDAALAFQ